jgi:response regulator NasT
LPAPVILVAAQEGKLAETRLATTDIFGYLVRPINAATLHQAMLVAVVQFQRFYGARAEADALREAFASRKIIDRAKGIIMQRRRLSENEAYAFLREESRRLRTPIVEIARSLLNEADPSVGAGKAGHLSSAPSTGRGVGTVTSPASRVLRSA